MKVKLIRILAIMMAASLLLTAAACKGTATPTEPGAVEPTKETVSEPTEEAAPPEEVEVAKIGVYTVAWSAPSQEMMATLIDMFNDEYKGKIEAEYIQGDWGEGNTYISAGVAGGGGIADAIEWWTGEALDWYGQGFLYDLAPYVTDEIRATAPEILWDAGTAEDGAIFFSCTVTGEHSLLYYNPKLFEEAGVEPPAPGIAWTWEELLANAKLLTIDANGKHLGEDGFDPENVVQWGYMPRLDNEKLWEEASLFAMQASAKPMIRKEADGVWDIFFDEEAMPVLRTYFSVIEEGVTPETAIGLTGDSQDELFVQGKAAIVFRGYFNIGVLKDRYPDFEFAVMSTPLQPGSKYYVSNINQGFAVPITSEHPEAAAEFVFWFQQATPQAMWASALFMAPCNPDALNDPVLKDDPDWDAMRFYKSIEELLSMEYNVNQKEFQTTLYAPNMMSVIMGEKTLDEAIAEIKSVSQDILNQ